MRVALGDLTRDGVPDLVAAPGKGAGAEIRTWDGTDGADLGAIAAFEPGFKGGVTVAAGDVDADGHDDVIVAPAGGRGPDVAVFSGDGLTSLALFPAFEVDFKGGVSVAAADFDLDGDVEIVTAAGKGRAPEVRVFDGTGAPFVSGALPAFQNAFLAYDATFRKGVFVAAGDVNGDGTADIVVGPGKGAAPEVAVFSGVDGAELGRFLAFDAKQRGGVRVAVGDIDGDGRAEILAAPGKGAKGGTAVRAFDGRTFADVTSFPAFDAEYKRGVFVSGVRR
ncbi:MAG TPA: VCBS repeat-containing protein [Myxococcota bacterium]|nr:VCBS repeat-containing protein [Myxococcota bacterium]